MSVVERKAEAKMFYRLRIMLFKYFIFISQTTMWFYFRFVETACNIDPQIASS